MKCTCPTWTTTYECALERAVNCKSEEVSFGFTEKEKCNQFFKKPWKTAVAALPAAIRGFRQLFLGGFHIWRPNRREGVKKYHKFVEKQYRFCGWGQKIPKFSGRHIWKPPSVSFRLISRKTAEKTVLFAPQMCNIRDRLVTLATFEQWYLVGLSVTFKWRSGCTYQFEHCDNFNHLAQKAKPQECKTQ